VAIAAAAVVGVYSAAAIASAGVAAEAAAVGAAALVEVAAAALEDGADRCTIRSFTCHSSLTTVPDSPQKIWCAPD
jgi:hypothetical protein